MPTAKKGKESQANDLVTTLKESKGGKRKKLAIAKYFFKFYIFNITPRNIAHMLYDN